MMQVIDMIGLRGDNPACNCTSISLSPDTGNALFSCSAKNLHHCTLAALFPNRAILQKGLVSSGIFLLAAGILSHSTNAAASGWQASTDQSTLKESPAQTDSQNRVTELDAVTALGRQLNLVGAAISASEGSVGQREIAERPLLRAGDLLEFVPGLVATQHSGSGKANQYFLRGFNLDHGTDFSTWVDGMPVNMRTHGHGQGYTDLNFLIPETVEELAYRKGNYYADVGDFSSAGSARFMLADTVDQGMIELTAGSYGYVRGVLVDSSKLAAGDLLYAGEAQTYQGPWDNVSEDVGKFSGLLRYSQDTEHGRMHVTVMGYRNRWNSADQIPQRAVDQGLISEYGQLDPDDGGETSRVSLSGGWQGAALGGTLDASAYAINYHLQLWSNFTYYLDDPVEGDQFEQRDDRNIYGFNLTQSWARGRATWSIGAESRFDDIGRVGLFHTRERQVLSTVRDDSVDEASLGVFAINEFRFNDRLRSYLGLRHDFYRFDVDSSLAANSGDATAGKTSVKASLVYRPIDPLELYASAGTGFHSNDARGTTITVDPGTLEPAQKVDPLAASKGAELGSRLYLSKRLQATLAFWRLDLDSELLFVGDAGTTEASRPSRRKGIEAGLYWFGSEYFSADLEASWSSARFTDSDLGGSKIPGSIPLVISMGAIARSGNGWLASVRLRHFGPYPLIEDNSVRSDGSTALNVRVGREWAKLGVYLDVLNALDSDDHDIDYYFASRLDGEPVDGVEDLHFHVFEPRSLRLSLRYAF